LMAAAAVLGIGAPTADSSDSNLVEIVKSRWMQESLLGTTFRFPSRSWVWGKPRDVSMTLLNYVQANDVDQGTEQVARLVSVYQDPKTKVLTISVETFSPELSRSICEKVLALVETFIQKRGRTRGGYKAAFAMDRLQEARAEMSASEGELRAFLVRNVNYASSQDPSAKIIGLRLEAELKLRHEIVSTLSLNYEQALMEEKNDIPILNVLDAPNLPIKKVWPPRSSIVLWVFVGTIAAGFAAVRKRELASLLSHYFFSDSRVATERVEP